MFYCSVKLSLKFPDMEGIFRMPVLLRIYPAIFVWIDLEGVCLGPMQPGFQLMYPKEMVFHPISLNDIDPPIQVMSFSLI